MDINIKTKLTNVFDEYIVNRKAMFIPIVAVASFMLVGYAATDKEMPEIRSNQIEVPYGEKLDLDSIDIIDNKDSRELIDVKADTSSLNVNQLGVLLPIKVLMWRQKQLKLLLLIKKNLSLRCWEQVKVMLLKFQ